MKPPALMLVAVLAVPFAVAEDAPPYPHPLPAWYKAQLKALETKLSCDFTGTPLDEAAKFLAEMSGVAIAVDVVGLGEAELAIDLRTSTLELGLTLTLMLQLKKLELRHTEAGLVICSDPAKYPLPEHAPIHARFVAARQQVELAKQRAQKPEVDVEAALRARLAEKRVSFTLDRTPLADVVSAIQAQVELNIVLDRSSVDASAMVTAKIEDQPVGPALEAVLATCGLGWYASHGVVYVTTQAKAASERECQATRATAALAAAKKLADFLATKVPATLRGRRPHELPALLAPVLGIPFHVEEAVWVANRPIAAETADQPLSAVAVALEAEGYLIVVLDDGVFMLAK